MGPSITRTNIPICWVKKAEDLDSSDVKPLPIAPRRTTGWSRIEGTKKPGRIKDAMLISQEGENVLLQLINEGAKLRPQSVLAKGVLQQLARRSKKEVGELIDPPLSSAKGFDVGVTK
jgi:hypothetical protein